jgi:hypothetical protein
MVTVSSQQTAIDTQAAGMTLEQRVQALECSIDIALDALSATFMSL